MRRWTGVVLAALLGACGVELIDSPGRACDDGHPCAAPRSCRTGFCFSDTEWAARQDAGPTDAGVDAGPLDSGVDAGPVDAGVDAGQPVWVQRVHGFTSNTTGAGCTLTIDPLRGNTVTATIASARAGQDVARAELLDPARLPKRTDGHLRGRVTLPVALSLSARSNFFSLGTQTGTPWLLLGFNANRALVVESAAGTLAPAALNQTLRPDGGFLQGDYLVDVSWQHGGLRRVEVNGVLLGEVAVPASGGATTPPDELRMGILDYAGDAGTGWTVTLSDWRLADDAQLDLGAP